MRWLRRFVGALLLTSLTAFLDASGSQQREPTFLGVIDSDGLLTPIAVYDGQEWWNRWPWGAESDEIKALPLPRSLADIPGDWLPQGARLPVNWTVLRPSGGRVAIRALNPARRSGFQLMETVVIRTTLPKRRGESFEDAAVIAGPGVLARFVSPTRTEARRILDQLEQTISRLQQDELRRWVAERRDRSELALTRVERIQTPSGTTIVRAAPDAPMAIGLSKADVPVDNRYYYHLRGEELYTMRPGDDCKVNLSTEGVIVVAGGRVVSQRISSWAYAEYCGDAAEWSTPIAAFSLNGKTRWIMRDSVEDGYDYTLFNPDTGDSELLKGTWAMRDSGVVSWVPWEVPRSTATSHGYAPARRSQRATKITKPWSLFASSVVSAFRRNFAPPAFRLKAETTKIQKAL